MNRPEATEYADYYANYISKVPGSEVLSVLESQRLQMLQLFAGRSERDGSFRYAPGKWTVKEVLGHITDTERIFAYRALRFARADQTPLPGFEQEDYVRSGGACERAHAGPLREVWGQSGPGLTPLRSLHASRSSRPGGAQEEGVQGRA